MLPRCRMQPRPHARRHAGMIGRMIEDEVRATALRIVRLEARGERVGQASLLEALGASA